MRQHHVHPAISRLQLSHLSQLFIRVSTSQSCSYAPNTAVEFGTRKDANAATLPEIAVSQSPSERPGDIVTPSLADNFHGSSRTLGSPRRPRRASLPEAELRAIQSPLPAVNPDHPLAVDDGMSLTRSVLTVSTPGGFMSPASSQFTPSMRLDLENRNFTPHRAGQFDSPEALQLSPSPPQLFPLTSEWLDTRSIEASWSWHLWRYLLLPQELAPKASSLTDAIAPLLVGLYSHDPFVTNAAASCLGPIFLELAGERTAASRPIKLRDFGTKGEPKKQVGETVSSRDDSLALVAMVGGTLAVLSDVWPSLIQVLPDVKAIQLCLDLARVLLNCSQRADLIGKSSVHLHETVVTTLSSAWCRLLHLLLSGHAIRAVIPQPVLRRLTNDSEDSTDSGSEAAAQPSIEHGVFCDALNDITSWINDEATQELKSEPLPSIAPSQEEMWTQQWRRGARALLGITKSTAGGCQPAAAIPLGRALYRLSSLFDACSVEFSEATKLPFRGMSLNWAIWCSGLACELSKPVQLRSNGLPHALWHARLQVATLEALTLACQTVSEVRY